MRKCRKARKVGREESNLNVGLRPNKKACISSPCVFNVSMLLGCSDEARGCLFPVQFLG